LLPFKLYDSLKQRAEDNHRIEGKSPLKAISLAQPEMFPFGVRAEQGVKPRFSTSFALEKTIPKDVDRTFLTCPFSGVANEFAHY